MINRSKTLAETHSELCVEYRKMLMVKAAGTGSCTNCTQPELEHLPDGRCSANALSRHFQWKGQAELDKINRALVLLEELMSL